MPRRLHIHIPYEVSHPLLAAKRKEHLKPYRDTAGLVLACLVGLPVLAFFGGVVVFLLMGLN